MQKPERIRIEYATCLPSHVWLAVAIVVPKLRRCLQKCHKSQHATSAQVLHNPIFIMLLNSTTLGKEAWLFSYLGASSLPVFKGAGFTGRVSGDGNEDGKA